MGKNRPPNRVLDGNLNRDTVNLTERKYDYQFIRMVLDRQRELEEDGCANASFETPYRLRIRDIGRAVECLERLAKAERGQGV